MAYRARMRKIRQKKKSRLKKKLLRKYIKSQRDKRICSKMKRRDGVIASKGGKAMHREGESCGGWVMCRAQADKAQTRSRGRAWCLSAIQPLSYSVTY